MTLEEKAAQLDMLSAKEDSLMKDADTFIEESVVRFFDSMCIGSIHDFYPKTAALSNELQRRAVEKSRLGIPVLFIEEGLHGYCGAGATNFPVPIGNASSWDTTLMYNIGRVIATEARAHGIHFLLNPNLDLAREPRWGRTEETYGEDVYLNSRMAVNMIKGMQGTDLKDNNAVAAEPKHFGVHGIPESGSNTGPVFIGEREARSTHLYVFEKAVREGKARGIMAAYHDIDGVPCISSEWLLTDLLRKEWGFEGMVVTDLGAIRRLLEPHYTAASPKEAVTQAITAGLSMQFYDFDHETFQSAVVEAAKDGSLSKDKLNRAVADVLRLKFELGLFENPYTDETLIDKVFHNETHQALALEAGRKSIVLLKNEHGTLPLSKNLKRIALIGNLADMSSIGGYGPRDAKGVTVYEALKQRFGSNIQINYVQTGMSAKITQAVAASDVAIVVLGETDREVGEGKDRQNLNMKQADIDMLEAVAKGGKPVVSVLLNGRPLVFTPVEEKSNAIVEGWFPGENGGNAIVDVLFGDYNPSGKLTISIPKYQGQLPIYYSKKPSSPRNYTDGNGEPLFPFGHGLSYSSFEYSNLSITPENPAVKAHITVTLDVKNTGKVAGTETVQLYVRDKIGSVATPVKALKGFSQIHLKAGETQKVTLSITPEEHLWLINNEMKRVVEPGEFEFMLGSSSADIRLKQTINLK
ncbi:beta-glucosidase [Bacteroidia bacterium]|nr:beta-glucosidase [Bacteroidia bacterium]